MWIQTYTGRKFWPLDPSEEEVCIEDIAHALALKCRYTGHCRHFYSIAQHSVIVSQMVPESDALWGLLHDSAEAYLPDVARPIKQAMEVRCSPEARPVSFKTAENRILTAVANAFDIPNPMPSTVTAADVCLLERERRQMLGPPPEEWSTAKWWDGDTKPIECWIPELSELRFLERFRWLRTGGTQCS